MKRSLWLVVGFACLTGSPSLAAAAAPPTSTANAAAVQVSAAPAPPPFQVLASATMPKPKLVLAISIDQFSANLFEEYRPRYTAGLKRLSGGVVYSQGYQSHGGTETCPGHSTLLTGMRPNHTGMVANNFAPIPPRVTGEPVTLDRSYCLYDPDVVLAGSTANPVSPRNLLATTLGDWLHADNPASRVVAISGKDRGALNMAGHTPDAVFWYGGAGGFTTYMQKGADPSVLLGPIAAVNTATAAERAKPSPWKYTTPYCRTLEQSWRLGTTTVDLKLPIDKPTTGNSPLLDDFTLAGALSLLDRFKLGRGPGTDLLAVSFSATDYVGHTFGSRGPEMCEQMMRLDASIGRLLAAVDKLRIPYVVALSADHGASDFSERLAGEGYPAAVRVSGAAVLARVNDALKAQLGLTINALSGDVLEPILNPAIPAAQRTAVLNAAVGVLKRQPEIADAFTLDQVLASSIPKGLPPDEFSLVQRLGASAMRGRSGDILAAFQPDAYPGGRLPAAGHGSPWNYDRRVPIIFWWPGVAGQTRFLPIETVDIAPTLANLIGLKVPPNLDGRCLAMPGAPCSAP